MTLLADFWDALFPQRGWISEPDEVFPDPIYRIRTKPGFIFDDRFWDTFHRFPFRICHVAYYGPERSEDDSPEARKANTGVFEMRFKPDESEDHA